jgi:hypothetical protein
MHRSEAVAIYFGRYFNKTFFPEITNGPNKLGCLSLAGLYSLVLCSKIKAGAYLRGNLLFLSGRIRPYPQILDCARDKHSSLFVPFVIYDKKSFVRLVSGWNFSRKIHLDNNCPTAEKKHLIIIFENVHLISFKFN